MARRKGRSKIFETRYFGFIIGLIVFAFFYWLSFGLNVIESMEQSFFLDVCFNWKLTFRGEKIQEGVTIKRQNPFVSNDILIIGIDNKSLQRFGKWPFPRSVHASMINSFTRIRDQQKRERVLFLDVNFIEPDINNPANDVILVKSIEENERVFLDTFLQPGELTGPLANEFMERQKTLIENYGAITKIKGDVSNILVSRSAEAPLKPYARAARGYGNASYAEDVDNVFRRQPLLTRLAEVIEEMRFSDLTPDHRVDRSNFERLSWIDRDNVIHDIPLPLTAEVLKKVKKEMEKKAPAKLVDTNKDGKPDQQFYVVRKYKDHIIPAITLTLALEYFNRSLSEIEINLGDHIYIPNPQVFNAETQKWEPYRLLVSPPVYKSVKDSDGKQQEVLVKEAVYRELDELKIPIDEKGSMLINFMGSRSSSDPSGYQTFPIRPYTGYIRDPGPDASDWPKTKAVANKILMVGIFATGLAEDEKPTPYGLMYGVEINANALNTILMNRFLIPVPKWVNVLILLSGIMFISFMTSRVSTIWSLVSTLLLILVFFLVVIYIFDFASTIITFTAPALGVLLTFLAIVAYRVMTEERDKARIKNMFGKYVSPAVVDQILDNPPELGGVDKELTVFFSDIRGFTTLSENMSPQALVNHLNVYLTAMTDIILEYHGTLDKYVGDEIMCFWGAPLPQEDHALHACRCAIEQMEKLRQLNESWSLERRINIGIGINSGIMTVGNMGSMGRMNYTLTGDMVNLGARLEGTNKEYGTNIIISEYTYGLVKDKVVVRELDNIRVKGKSKPVLIYELLDVTDGQG
jgi:adenylate cyclase